MKKAILFLAFSLTSSLIFAQDAKSTSAPLEISGSADGYFKYDFSKNPNIQTSFANDQNSFSLGMLNVILKKNTGKVSFVGDLSFGPRGQGQSIPNGDRTAFAADNSFHIQNLYLTYAVTDKLSVTGGYAGTYIGYEVISPVGNFHYSTSYLFTNGPFQHGGVKVNYKINDKFGAMLGVFNDKWNNYSSWSSIGALGGQFSYSSNGISAYANFMNSKENGLIIDFTGSLQLTKEFKLGLNAADLTLDKTGYTGFALYPSYAFSDTFAFGLRGEYFKTKAHSGNYDVTGLTATANFKLAGGLTIIPEMRFDSNTDKKLNFVSKDNVATAQATQFAIAMVYAF